MSLAEFLAKFKNLKFWQFFKICNFDFVLFWLGIWCESLVWVIMGRRGVSQNAGVLVVLVGLGNGLASIRRHATIPGTIPQFRDNWFKTQGYFIIKQNETNILSSTIYLKTNKNTNTTQSVCEPLSEPMMARCVLKVPKFKHDTFGRRAFEVCGPLSWNLGCAMKLKHSSEP